MYVSFVVDTNGYVWDSKILKDIGANCGTEAKRVIDKTSGKWLPGTVKGRKVNARISLPIKFSVKDAVLTRQLLYGK